MKFTKKTKVFVTGCGGMLGEAVYQTLIKICKVRATDVDVNDTFLKFCDIRDIDDVAKQITAYNPDIVFHLAALTDLEYCEKNPDHTWEVNAFDTEQIALICQRKKLPMVYISTAGIFDGKQEFYVDYELPRPLSVYGKAKYAGELAVQRIVDKHFIFRAGWMMGGGPKKDKKFVNKIMKQILAGKKILNVVDDKLGTPTYTFDFVKNMILVIEMNKYGLYNLVCDDSCTRLDVANEIVKFIKRPDIKVKKVPSSYFKKEYFAPRPYSEKLICFKLKKERLYIMRKWQVALKEYVKRWAPLLKNQS